MRPNVQRARGEPVGIFERSQKERESRSLSPTPVCGTQVIGTHPSISDFRILLRLFKARALAPRTNILPASNDRQFPALTHAKGPPHAPTVWSRPFSFWAFRVWGKSNTEVETTAPVVMIGTDLRRALCCDSGAVPFGRRSCPAERQDAGALDDPAALILCTTATTRSVI